MAPEVILYGILIAGVILYAVFGGADFGAGIWEFNLAFSDDTRDRDLVHSAIGPVWETNHVWLIFVLVIMWSAFPPLAQAVGNALWLPLLLALTGIVFRGAAYALRGYVKHPLLKNTLTAIFGVASAAAPFFLGASCGVIASNEPMESRHANQWLEWMNSLSVYGGVFGLGVCAYISAVLMAREAYARKESHQITVWRERALVTGIWMGLGAGLGLIVAADAAPMLWAGLGGRASFAIAGSVLFGAISLLALFWYRFHLASLCAGGAVAFVIIGGAIARYPHILASDITVQNAKAPDAVLWALIVSIAIGSLLLGPSLWLLFRVFKSSEAIQHSPEGMY